MRRKILDQNGINYLTMTIVNWIDLFTRKIYCDIFIDALKYCQKEKGLKVYAFVIMSNHVHLVVGTDSPSGLSPILQSLIRHTTKSFLIYINDCQQIESRRTWLLENFKRSTIRSGMKHKIWQKGFYPFLLTTPKMIIQKILYIHKNPVTAGTVQEPQHYVYSSASNYVDGTGVLDVVVLDEVWYML